MKPLTLTLTLTLTLALRLGRSLPTSRLVAPTLPTPRTLPDTGPGQSPNAVPFLHCSSPYTVPPFSMQFDSRKYWLPPLSSSAVRVRVRVKVRVRVRVSVRV